MDTNNPNGTQYSHIADTLQLIERAHNVKILFACESGSRAWGFASPDSDFDVRFIYIHHPEWYLHVPRYLKSTQPRDTIEHGIEKTAIGDFDINGWDLRKALGLMAQSNLTMLEWLGSPIHYRRDDNFHSGALSLGKHLFDAERCRLHYLSMADNNWNSLNAMAQDDTVPYKKYLYMARSLCAAKFVTEYRSMPPTSFIRLLERIDIGPVLRAEIEELLARKRELPELGMGPRMYALEQFLRDSIIRQRGDHRQGSEDDMLMLDKFFRDMLARYEGHLVSQYSLDAARQYNRP